MIALPSISQVKYIINKTPFICYTLNENRKLGLLLLEGDKNKELVRQDSILININNELNLTYKNQIKTFTEKSVIDKLTSDSLKLKIIVDREIADKLASKNKTHKIILGTISTIGLVGCLVLILLH